MSRVISFGLFVLLAAASEAAAQGISVRSDHRKGDFPLVRNDKVATIVYSDADHKVVHLAAADLASDIERVTGKRPTTSTSIAATQTAVIIGTIGKSPFIDELIKAGKLDARQIRGKWESFVIRTVDDPRPNVAKAVVVAGSDRRGTAFGVYELSRIIGVSPWYWWADVTPERKANLVLSPGTIVSREPSVKYRGIFINDEDWGLQPWAAKTFEPETGDIGPKTYAKVFELLLRLKANTLWPAMHEVTRPFNSIAANRQVADDHAIVMGSSHAEPMLRNNVGEWKADKNAFNFVTNADGVTDYWEQRTRENGRFENIYTIGMRGIHDSPILGTKSQSERIPLLEKIFSVQRGLIAKHVDPNVETVPQIFCPYKEVLADYRAGLKVPDDVTIVFPDDNFGYIRQFPNAEEQKRRGGFGVYYHISYLGRPMSYLWLNTTPPALIWEEMSKAYENGMRRLWIVNVGDIKPAEIGMEFFLQMAYDAEYWNVRNQHQFLNAWAKREFGEGYAAEIAYIMDQYFQLGFQRKPEHLQWYLPKETPRMSDFTEMETAERLVNYANLRKRAEGVYEQLSQLKKDAFYELVLYPVRSAQLANERFFSAEIADRLRAQNSPNAIEAARRSIAADAEIRRETKYFNEQLQNGKWRHIMSPEISDGQWPSMRSTPPRISEKDYEADPNKPDTTSNYHEWLAPDKFPKDFKGFVHWRGVVSIEAEHFTAKTDKDGFGWEAISGLGKTGSSVSVFPQLAKTFSNDGPTIEYRFYVSKSLDFLATFLIPTQPLIPKNGLRFAFSVDGGERQIITVDKDTEVSSPNWAANILDATTLGKARIKLKKGEHVLRIYAVDTGVILDKIVLSEGELPTSYFGPAETLRK